MALPGLSVGNTVPIVEDKKTIIQELKAETEWRFEVAFGDEVEVRLLSGTAEIYGTELAQNQPYLFNGRKAAVYTWHGCRLEVSGRCQIDYVAEETPMASYANTHFALEGLRDDAAGRGLQGPRVLVIGPENAGKTSLVKFLASYALRVGRRPVVASLDPREGMLTLPGTLSAVALESIIDVEEGWGSSPMNGPSLIPVKLPLVYYYGLEDPDAQAKSLFEPLVTRLALSVVNRMEDDADAKSTGCFIDTAGSISQGKGNYEIIQHIVAEFSVNVIIALGSERLYNDMVRRFSRHGLNGNGAISVVKLDKSGGSVDRDTQYLNLVRRAQIRSYFFGDPKNTLNPYTQQIDFQHVSVFKITERSTFMASLLPGGESDDLRKLDIYEKVEPSNAMQSCVLATVQANPDDPQSTIRDSSVIGFVYVTEVDEQRRRLKLLSPLGGRIPSRAMIWGTWPEPTPDLV